MPLREILAELEDPPFTGCSMLDMEKLLVAAGYLKSIDEGQAVFCKEGSYPLTFGVSEVHIFQSRAEGIFALIKRQEGIK